MDDDVILFTTEARVTSEDVAQAGYELMCQLKPRKQDKSWEELTEGDRERWRDLAGTIFTYVSQELEVKFETLAEHVKKADRRQAKKIVFECVARHMVSLCMAEDTEDLDAISKHSWSDWMKHRKVKA